MLLRLRARLVHLVLVVLLVSVVTFVLTALLPGDPATAQLGINASPEQVEALRADMGVDQPPLSRYVDWLSQAAQGDLGEMHRTGQPVSEAIVSRLPVTLEIIAVSQVIALALSIPLGIASAHRRGRLTDRAIGTLSFSFISVPAFVAGILLVYIFSIKLHIFPATGWTRPTDNLLENLRSVALPSLTLAIAQIAIYQRILRSELVATLQEDFIVTARAKGMAPARVLFGEALRPSSLSLVTVVALDIGRLIGGAVIVEHLFAIPGMGKLILDGVATRDFILVQAVVLCTAIGYVAINTLADSLYSMLDPRIRYGDH